MFFILSKCKSENICMSAYSCILWELVAYIYIVKKMIVCRRGRSRVKEKEGKNRAMNEEKSGRGRGRGPGSWVRARWRTSSRTNTSPYCRRWFYVKNREKSPRSVARDMAPAYFLPSMSYVACAQCVYMLTRPLHAQPCHDACAQGARFATFNLLRNGGIDYQSHFISSWKKISPSSLNSIFKIKNV